MLGYLPNLFGLLQLMTMGIVKRITVEERASLRKLLAETRLLEDQFARRNSLSERVRAFSGLGGIVTVLVAIFSLYFTADKGLREYELTREARSEERMDKALERLSANSPAQRITSVSSLRSFLRVTDPTGLRHTQVLSALAHALLHERDSRVRGAIVETFSTLDRSIVVDETRKSALATIVALNRLITNEANLGLKRAGRHEKPELGSDEAIAYDLGHSLAALARSGTPIITLGGIYCRDCDFSRLNFGKAEFTNAILMHANFFGANLRAASFTNADLDSADFRQVDARDAKFSISGQSMPIQMEVPFETQHAPLQTWTRLPVGNVGTIRGPNFSCADLRGADFSGRPLFGVSYPDNNFSPEIMNFRKKHRIPTSTVSTFMITRFHMANLKGTNFSKIRFLVGANRSEREQEMDKIILSSDFSRHKHGKGFIKEIDLGGYHLMIDHEKAEKFFYWAIHSSFELTNWEQSTLSEKFRAWVRTLPLATDYNSPFAKNLKAEIACNPRSEQ